MEYYCAHVLIENVNFGRCIEFNTLATDFPSQALADGRFFRDHFGDDCKVTYYATERLRNSDWIQVSGSKLERGVVESVFLIKDRNPKELGVVGKNKIKSATSEG